MTTLDTPTEDDADAPPPFDPPPVRPGRRRRPAPRANPFWRFVFPLLVIAAGAAVFALWRTGTKAVLDSTDGREVDVVTDPAEPGYEVFVDPTPTLLVLHHDRDELVGVSVMARTALDEGGTLVLLGPDLLVTTGDGAGDGDGAGAVLLSVAYADDGADAVRDLAEGLFGFGFLEVVEMETATLGNVMRLVEPIPFLLADDLVVDDGAGGVDLWLDRGRVELGGEVAAQVYGFRNPGEADAARLERQLALWTSWLTEIERADDLLAATLPFDTGLAPYLRSFVAGTSDLAVPPVDPLLFAPDQRPVYVLADAGERWLADRSREMVPLPISPQATSRPSIRLLDGTGDVANRDRLLPEMVDAGAVVAVIGNADEFGVATSSVAYHRPEMADAARALAAEFGIDAVFDDDLDEPVDLTVTVGLDLEAG